MERIDMEKIIELLTEIAEHFRGCRDNVSFASKAENHFWELQNAANEAVELLKEQEAKKVINAPTVCEWVSVKDRLPKHGKRYLIYATSGDNKIGYITTTSFGGHFVLSGRRAYWKVTHWMPLPEPPKEDEDD